MYGEKKLARGAEIHKRIDTRTKVLSLAALSARVCSYVHLPLDVDAVCMWDVFVCVAEVFTGSLKAAVGAGRLINRR